MSATVTDRSSADKGKRGELEFFVEKLIHGARR